jgi:hypothetical protein
MSRFSFQIEPTAEFQCVKPSSELNGLRAKLFGRTSFTTWAPVTAPVASAKPSRHIHARTAAARVPLRKRASAADSRLKFVRSRLSHSEPVPEAASAGAALAPPGLVQQVKYKGHMISAAQNEDGNWIATREPEAANGPAAQKRNSYLARSLAIAEAELEIDEIEEKKLLAMRARFQEHEA